MSFWGEIRERIPLWGSRTIQAVVALVVICSIAHHAGIIVLLPVPHDLVMEVLIACSITLAFFLFEGFVGNDHRLKSVELQLETLRDISPFSSKEEFLLTVEGNVWKLQEFFILGQVQPNHHRRTV
jgi:hypothetical protein